VWSSSGEVIRARGPVIWRSSVRREEFMFCWEKGYYGVVEDGESRAMGQFLITRTFESWP